MAGSESVCLVIFFQAFDSLTESLTFDRLLLGVNQSEG